MTPLEHIETMILEDEGGWKFTDRPDDAGGPTYGGMTWKTFNRWQFIHVAKQDQYTEGEFIAIADHGPHTEAFVGGLRNRIRACYYEEFWIRGRVGKVPEFAQPMYLSHCVNTSTKEGLKILQMAYNFVVSTEILMVDGHWGPKTKRAMDNVGRNADDDLKRIFRLAFSDAAAQRYIRIVQQNDREWRAHALNPGRYPKPRVLQSQNLMGWFNRAVSYRNK